MASVTALSTLSSSISVGRLSSPTVQQKSRRSVLSVRAAFDPASPDADVINQDVLEYAKTMPGISFPFPNIFDPVNLLERAASSVQPVRELRRWREAEITHGRVSMLAALGFIVGEQLEDFPTLYNFDGHITGPAIYHFQQVEARGAIFWLPLVFFIGLCESYRVGLGWATPQSGDFNFLNKDYEPGNLGFDPLGLLPTDPAEKKVLQTKELNNGRLAMIAIAGFVAQELVSGEEIFEHLFKRLGWA